MTKKFLLVTFFFAFFHSIQAQLEYSLTPGRQEIIERDFDRLCQLDFDAEFEFGDKEKWESVLKRAFGIEKIDCLAFKNFIEERVGLVVDHFQSDNLITIHFDGTVKRQEDWNFLFRNNVEIFVEKLNLFIQENEVLGSRLEKRVHIMLYKPVNEFIWFLMRGMRIRNYYFALKYTTNGGETRPFPISLEASVPGVVFLSDEIFNNSYDSFYRISNLIHEARHESREFFSRSLLEL